MKKILTRLLVLAMEFSITACGKKASDGASNDTPLDVLTKVWEKYEDDEKFITTYDNVDDGYSGGLLFNPDEL